MTNLFRKAACFTDLHLGNKGNSKQNNEDCQNFISWFIEEAKKENAETCIFLGDWSHNRRQIEVSTLNHSLLALEKLSKAFEQVFLIMGNHDEFFREKRDLNSIPYAKKFPNITLIEHPIVIGGVALIPWLNPGEHKKIKEMKCQLMFGHFELGQFKMNQMIEMPDTTELKYTDFTIPRLVFSGHFHKRQQKGNVIYIGNAFPHNYADNFDDERGAMFLEWNGEPEFKSWLLTPKYRILKLSELIQSPEKYIDAQTYMKIVIDTELTFEEASLIKESFQETYNPRELQLVPNIVDIEEYNFEGNIVFESVDQIVIEGLNSLDSDSLDKNLLVEIYQNLNTKQD